MQFCIEHILVAANTTSLPLTLAGHSFLKNLLTNELWMFLRMTPFFLSWWPRDLLLPNPTETAWVTETNSFGEPRDEQLSPWPHGALSGTTIKPQTWFYHSWKELVTPACTTYSISLAVRLQQPWREGREEPELLHWLCRDIPSPSAAPWTELVLEASRADGLFPGVNNWKLSPSSGSTNVEHTLIPVSYLLEKYHSLGIAHTGWALHWAAALWLKLGACAQFLLILNCGDSGFGASVGSSETVCVWHSQHHWALSFWGLPCITVPQGRKFHGFFLARFWIKPTFFHLLK